MGSTASILCSPSSAGSPTNNGDMSGNYKSLDRLGTDLCLSLVPRLCFYDHFISYHLTYLIGPRFHVFPRDPGKDAVRGQFLRSEACIFPRGPEDKRGILSLYHGYAGTPNIPRFPNRGDIDPNIPRFLNRGDIDPNIPRFLNRGDIDPNIPRFPNRGDIENQYSQYSTFFANRGDIEN